MITFLVCLWAATAEPVQTVDEFFATFSKKRDTVQTLEASFTQENVTPEETKKTSGVVYYVKPRRIMFRYTDPQTTYLVDGQTVYQYETDLKQVQIIDLEDDPQTEAFFLGFDDNTDRLKEAYTITLFTPDVKSCGSKGLVLVPKPMAEDLKRDQKYFEQVRIALDDARYLPCHIEIVNDKDSKVLITITGVKLNADSSMKDLKIKVPEGTAIIENDDLVETTGPDGAWLPRSPIRPISPLAPPLVPEVSSQELKAP